MHRAERPGGGPLPLAHALALGLLQGPTELLPISSSAHTALLAQALGSPYAQLDGGRRKSFEVALHAGAGAALAIHMRRQLLSDAARVDAPRALAIALAIAPPALAGYALERPIERSLGGPRSIAAGLLAGALAMAAADARSTGGRGRAGRGRGRRGRAGRGQEDLRAGDGLALGLAQAAALVPGVSRNGAALSAARARGFDRRAAQALSWHAGLPVLLGASALKGMRLRGQVRTVRENAALGAGIASAFASTLASARLMRRALGHGYRLWPFSLYRCLLAALVLARSPGRAARDPSNP